MDVFWVANTTGIPLAAHIEHQVIWLSATSIMIWLWLLHSLMYDKVAVAVDHLRTRLSMHRHIKQTYYFILSWSVLAIITQGSQSISAGPGIVSTVIAGKFGEINLCEH